MQKERGLPLRQILPNRRDSRILDVWFNNERYHVSYSRDPRGTDIREVFIHGPKVGSDIDAISYTVGVTLSIALQRGATLEELSHSVARHPNGEAADFIGYIIDTLRKEPL